MRAFIAIDLPENIKEELAKIQRQLPEAKMKLVEKQNLHLTLRFLGEISDTQINKIKEKLREIKMKKFCSSLTSIGVFPSEKFVRIIWIGLKAEKGEEIFQLREKIEKAVEEAGMKKDERFESHLTLARVKFIKDKKGFIEKINQIKVKPLEFFVTNFALKKSTLTKAGPIYEDILKFELQ